MGIAIGKMVAEDPSFRVETDEDSLVKPSLKVWVNCTWTSKSTS